MRARRIKVVGAEAVYHCMTRTVNGERLFGDREKEVLRKMIWQVADFCGVEVLTYCVLANHFHVLLRVPGSVVISDSELLRRYRVMYPKPTKYQTASIAVLQKKLSRGDSEAEAIRHKLLARMGDVSEFMKAVKQRFSIWFNHTHHRFGTLWSERFKSVLVEGRGNPLQTMAAYIDLNPVRAGLVEDPKDYRFCGYAEAVAGNAGARQGLRVIWANYADGSLRDKGQESFTRAMSMHRELIFGKRAADPFLSAFSRKNALRVLEEEQGLLPKATVLRCRVRYFTDGAILGSSEFVRGLAENWRNERGLKRMPKLKRMRGADWEDLAVIGSLRRDVFG